MVEPPLPEAVVKAYYARWIFAFLLLLSSSVHAQTPKPAGKASRKADSTSAIGKQRWKIDTLHSELTFSVRHLAGRVRGRFHVWSGTITAAPGNWNDAAVDVVIQASSIDTENESRDNHLRSEDFFEVEKYSEITFKGTSAKRNGDSIAVVGKLTMKGITKPVILVGKFTQPTPGQAPHLDFRATTAINRLDYGVSYNRLLEGGGTTLGDEVTIDMVITAIPQ